MHVKFPSEATHATVTVPSPATPAGVCAAVLAARPDLGKMLDAKGQYAGFELSLVDPKTGRPMNPDDADAVPHDAKMELVLSKGYAVRAFAPVRKYVVGRFSGERPPKFKSGRATAVEWQLCRQRSDVTGREPNLQLVSESKKGGRVQFNGARESAGLGNFFLLMMQASTTDVCAIPMEQWYNFRPVANRRVMSLEEAEERLEARGRHTTSTSQWLEKVTKGAMDDDDDGLSDSDDVDRFKTQAGDSSDEDDENDGKKKKKKKKAGTIKQEPEEEDVKAGNDVGDAPGARGIVKAEGDDWEHDAGASDDEVAGEGMGDEIEMVDADDAKPPPKTGVGPNDDDEDEDEDLDAEGAKLKRLLGREEEAATAAELGGFSDDDDSDSEFVDPDQEELHPFLLQQRNKAEQAQIQKAQAAAQAAQRAAQAAAQAAAAAVVVKPEPVAAGVKRARDDEGDANAAAAPAAKAIKTEAGAGAAMRPIEAALRAILRGASKVTTKDVTKQLRKKGLLGTDEDKEELKSTIGRVAKINKEGAASYVVLK